MRPLTARQREVVCAIDTLTAQQGYPPTWRELMAALGLRSANTINGHLHSLRVKGAVTWRPEGRRTLRVVRREE